MPNSSATSGGSGFDFSQQYQGVTNGQIVRSLGNQQIDLLRAWMGLGAKGASRATGQPLPQGLLVGTLRAYHEVARRQIAAGLDKVGTQAARIKLIEHALRALGH